MLLRSILLTACVVASGLLALTLPAISAQDKKTPDEAESVDADPVLELATTAYKTEEFGRANNSPESLVAAAIMLRSLKSVTKTAITLKGGRRGFAGAKPKARWLDGYLDLQRPIDDDSASPRAQVGHLTLGYGLNGERHIIEDAHIDFDGVHFIRAPAQFFEA